MIENFSDHVFGLMESKKIDELLEMVYTITYTSTTVSVQGELESVPIKRNEFDRDFIFSSRSGNNVFYKHTRGYNYICLTVNITDQSLTNAELIANVFSAREAK